MSSIILRAGALPDDDSTVLIHLGAGQTRDVWNTVERNYDLYRPLPELRAGENLGAFGLSLFGLVNGLESGELFEVMNHNQYGQATFGAVRAVFAVHPTEAVDVNMSDETRQLQRAHFSLLLNHPTCPELATSSCGDLPAPVREAVRTSVVAQIEGSLLPLFSPRSPRPN